MPLLLAISFLAGALTILAPCALPIVPLVLGTGIGGGRWRPLGIVLGLAGSFTLATVVLVGLLTGLGFTTSTLRVIAVLALAGFGLTMAMPELGERMTRALTPLAAHGTRLGSRGTSLGGLAGGIVLGSALGLVWAPCSGPIMAGVIAIAVSRGPTPDSVAIAVAYAAGASLPLLGVALGGRSLVRRAGTVARRMAVRRAVGVAMIATCVAILGRFDLQLQETMARMLPAGWSSALYAIEEAAPTAAGLTELGANARVEDPELVDPGPDVAERIPEPVEPEPETGRTDTSEVAAGMALVPVSPSTSAPSTSNPSAAALGDSAELPEPVAGRLPAHVRLHDRGRAPELRGIDAWINSGPLTLRELRGKVVLVHFWTFGCINCIHVQPYVKAWYERYRDAGFTVVGVHTPELSYERDLANVRQAVRDQGVEFPVAFDPDFATWRAYRNIYWPAFYFVDKRGQIRFEDAGEGNYDRSEQIIRQLLAEPMAG